MKKSLGLLWATLALLFLIGCITILPNWREPGIGVVKIVWCIVVAVVLIAVGIYRGWWKALIRWFQ